MAFIKLQTDAFINPKVRRLSDGAFRMWVYLLGQAWVEGPGKPAGVVRLKGVFAKDESRALDRAARTFGEACGSCGDNMSTVGDDLHPGMLNQLENVGLVHITTEEVGTAVGTRGTGPNPVPDGVWDIEISIHDWAHHNPRKAPSHTTEGEAERKRKYRSQKKNTNGANGASSPKRPKAPVPSVPSLDKDKDKDSDKDSDRQTDGWLTSLQFSLANYFGHPKPLGLGRDPERTRKEFSRWLSIRGLELTAAECVRLADEKGEKPMNLSWFVGWLETVPDSDLGRGLQ